MTGSPGRLRPVPAPVTAWNAANALTVLRLLLVPAFAGLLLSAGGHDPGRRLAAAATFLIAAVTDLMDGDLARRRGLVTDFGKLADPVADKALIGTALVALSILGDLSWLVAVVVLAREGAVTALRFWVLRHGVIAASRGGKLKTVLQTVAITLYVLPLPPAWAPVAAVLLAAAVAVTVVTGVDYVQRALRLRRAATPPTAVSARSG